MSKMANPITILLELQKSLDEGATVDPNNLDDGYMTSRE